MFRKAFASVLMTAVALAALAPAALAAGDEDDALRTRIAELEQRITQLEKLLKDKEAAIPEALPAVPAEPVPAEKVPEWARKQIEELLDRGIRGEFNIPGLGDMRVETLPRRRRAQLGIHINALGAEEAAAAKIETGVKIVKVVPESPAAEAGLRAGDILLKVNGEAMPTPAKVVETIGGRRVGDKVKLTVLREGVEFTVTAGLARAEADPWAMPKGGRPLERLREPMENWPDPFGRRRAPRERLRRGEAAPEANVETNIDTPDGRIHASVSAPTLFLGDRTAESLGIEGEELKKARAILKKARAGLAAELNTAAAKVAGGRASLDFTAVRKKMTELEGKTDRELAEALPADKMAAYRKWRRSRQGFSHSLRIERGVGGAGGAGGAMPEIRGLETF